MSVAEILDILKDRGFKVALKDDTPILQGNKEELTPALHESLKFHRAKIIEWLREDLKKQIEVSL